ncbi:ABC transporter ATP-binding protein [Haladaptatus sp. NG-WS-4]
MSSDLESLADRADHDFPLITLAWRYGRADAGRFVFAVLAGSISTFLSFADVYLIGLGIDALFNDQPFAVPLVPESWVPSTPLGLLTFVTLLMMTLNLSTNLLAFADDWASGVFAQRVLDRTRIASFDAIQEHELAFVEDERTGELLSALNDDVNQLSSFFTTIVGAAVWIAATIGSALVYMWFLEPQLAVLVLCCAPIIGWLNYRFSQRLDPIQDRVRATRGALNARLETALEGLSIIKVFTAEPFERDRVAAASRTDVDARLATKRLSARQPPVNRLLVGVWLIGVTTLGIVWVLEQPPWPFSGALTAGVLVPFLFYLERLSLPLRNLGGVIDHTTAARASARRILGIHATAGRSPADTHGQTTELSVTDGAVKASEVRYQYPRSDRPALDGVSFDVAGGQTVGIVGATGAGKSTLVEHLLRFRAPDAGTIEIDGRDIETASRASFREAVGYVSQTPHIFDGTVRYNIAYGATTTDIDAVPDAHVERAARLAGAHEFIVDLPDGYDTDIGSNGASLSGGQRQRLALARAIVDEPPLLVLDEATSQVDTETERRLQERLADVTAERTTFIVAHRLSMVRNADDILVFDDGTVTERGTHSELLAADGQYADLWNIQIGNISALDA